MIVCREVTGITSTPADTITLDETARHRRRAKLISDGGIAFLLDLPKARLLRHGEGLLLDDGRVIEVRAAPEALLEVQATDPRHLLALAWQIGNRHLPAQIEADRILIRRDHVIEEMLTGLGAMVARIEASFDPEGGAYGDTHESNHHHHDHDDHSHSHGQADHSHADRHD
ncbi:urease accessory protein UreE [Notoacmeibacter sp. MSK16QG-6]|uniref:urease accessory protein UreE n=1 Tax=Notoacmeibacter sp. MSK16QG-6 TaxID=2957982 RepID=UPI0020A22C06|nr:urease accessory protein UreE [Notoacmeibacter sp. MSK16QG-6]MCP1200404.1 urease accessory protein UreE [Notoacmeibacter sp. MSK16QG-6]